MSDPSVTEKAELARWSLVNHYAKFPLRYVKEGKIIFKNSPSGVLSKDELADGLRIWMASDAQWQQLLRNKSYLPVHDRDRITEIMSRYIVHKDYNNMIV